MRRYTTGTSQALRITKCAGIVLAGAMVIAALVGCSQATTSAVKSEAKAELSKIESELGTVPVSSEAFAEDEPTGTVATTGTSPAKKKSAAPKSGPFGPVINYASGYDPAIAGVESANLLIEAHMNEGRFLYTVNTVDPNNARVNWGPQQDASKLVGRAVSPAISVSNGGIVALAWPENNGGQTGNLYTAIGTVYSQSIDFGGSQWFAYQSNGTPGPGYYPSVAISRDGKTVVVAYQDSGVYTGNPVHLWYRVGSVDIQNKRVNWGTARTFADGWAPSISINDRNQLVCVHNSWQKGTGMWYEVGTLNPAAQTVSWSSAVSFNQGNYYTSVALGDVPPGLDQTTLVCVYPSRLGNHEFWVEQGTLGAPPASSVNWATSWDRGTMGAYPKVTYAYSNTFIEVHEAWNAASNALYYSVSQ